MILSRHEGNLGGSESVTTVVNLQLAGPFIAEFDKGLVSGLSRRAQALLAFLACQPAMRAERALIADLLWSDRSEDQARA